jgi:PsbP
VLNQVYDGLQVEGETAVYYVTVTVDQGKVFALFVSSPAKQFKQNKGQMNHMVKSFDIIA